MDRLQTSRVATDIAGGVVVGHDGSVHADRALAVAAEEAQLRKLPLHVVRAWTITTTPRPKDVPQGIVASEDQYHDAVAADMTAAVERVLDEDHGLAITLHVVHGAAAATLIAASKQATVLVVGSRGRGGFTGLLIGSTSTQVVEHAACPVVVIRGG